MRGQDTSGPGIADDDEATQERDDDQISIPGDDHAGDQEEPPERQTLIMTFKTAAPETDNAQRSVAVADPAKEQQAVVVLDRAAREKPTMMDDGTSDLSPGDPITSRRTLDYVEDFSDLSPGDLITMSRTLDSVKDLVNPPQTNAWNSNRMQEQPAERTSTTSPGLQSIFDEWLVPEHASETLSGDTQTSGDPVRPLNLEDPDLKSFLLFQ